MMEAHKLKILNGTLRHIFDKNHGRVDMPASKGRAATVYIRANDMASYVNIIHADSETNVYKINAQNIFKLLYRRACATT
jgi:hypothetical protein